MVAQVINSPIKSVGHGHAGDVVSDGDTGASAVCEVVPADGADIIESRFSVDGTTTDGDSAT